MPTFRVTLIRQRNKLHRDGRTATVPTRAWTFDARDEGEVRRLLAEAREQGLPYVQGYVLAGIEQFVDCARCNAGEACAEHGRVARRIGEFSSILRQ
jgi:hypothetical protein